MSWPVITARLASSRPARRLVGWLLLWPLLLILAPLWLSWRFPPFGLLVVVPVVVLVATASTTAAFLALLGGVVLIPITRLLLAGRRHNPKENG